MPICLRCNNSFPNWIKIDGKFKSLNSRKYCLDCSPHKLHNTRNLDLCSIDTKKCLRCGEIKILNTDNFYYKKDSINSKSRAYSYCKQCWIDQTLERFNKLKKLCVDYKGGKCQSCGYDKYIGSLDFHHIDRNTKSYNISHKLKAYSFNKLKLELDKCVLVCKNCHGEIESGIKKCPTNDFVAQLVE